MYKLDRQTVATMRCLVQLKNYRKRPIELEKPHNLKKLQRYLRYMMPCGLVGQSHVTGCLFGIEEVEGMRR